jgi:hypothetical protein
MVFLAFQRYAALAGIGNVSALATGKFQGEVRFHGFQRAYFFCYAVEDTFRFRVVLRDCVVRPSEKDKKAER